MHTAQQTTPTSTPAARGRILAYQPSGQGSVSVAGVQYPFDIASHWRSDTAPAINAVVDVRFNEAGAIDSLNLVSTQQLTQEEMAGAAKLAREKGQQVWGNAVSTLGVKVLAAIGVLVAGAFVFNTLGMRLFATVSHSYWQLLGLSTDSLESFARSSGGFTSAQFFFLLSIAACFATMASSHPKAALGKCAPLLFVVIHTSLLFFKIKGAVSQAGEAMNGMSAMLGARAARMADQMASEMLAQVWQGLSFGIGFYLVIAAAAVLAGFGYGEYKRKSIN